MKFFLLLIPFLFISCSSVSARPKQKQPNLNKLTVRLTVYWSSGGGSDKWTSNGKSSTGVRLKEGHIAVDPKIIPYGSSVNILGRDYKAVDTGTSVKKRTASRKTGRNEPVVDVYFKNKRDAISFSKKNPKIVTVTVKKP